MAPSEQAFWLKHLGEADRFTAWVGSEIRPFLGRSILEVGCGTGTFTRLFAGISERVLAIDIDKGFVALARDGMAVFPHVRVEQVDATTACLPQDFDTIVLLDVLEHIADDVGLLRSLHGALKPGGRLVVKVPAVPALYCPMDQAIGHFRRYDRAGLEGVLSAAGFVPEACRPFNMLGIAGWWLNGKLLRRRIPPAEQVELFERLVPWLRACERTLGPPVGLSLIAAAGKNGSVG